MAALAALLGLVGAVGFMGIKFVLVTDAPEQRPPVQRSFIQKP
jgi:hypothetical protein